MMNNDQTDMTNQQPEHQPAPSAAHGHPVAPHSANRRFMAFALIVLLGMAIVMIWQSVSPAQSAVAWQSDLDAAIAQAAEADKPVLISFSSPACVYCRQMESEVFPQKEVLAEVDKFIPVKINTFEDARTSARYGVEALPAYVVIAPDGKVLGMIDGFRPAPAFIRFLQYAATAAKSA